MLIRFAPALITLTLFATPALAGNVTVTADGKMSWQSTQCTVPTPPPSLSKNPETPANSMNARVTEYNAYVHAAESYMNCVSDEASRDAAGTSQMIVKTAQDIISREQEAVAASNAPLQAKQPGK